VYQHALQRDSAIERLLYCALTNAYVLLRIGKPDKENRIAAVDLRPTKKFPENFFHAPPSSLTHERKV
jgi:hypothetical protein